MSNIIQHPSVRRNAERRRAEREKLRAKLEREGGAALKNLIGWRRYIPMEDRIRLAENMENILLEYDIKTSELDWRKEYVSIENFRLDVHRMRMPADGLHGRRLVASSNRWVELLNLICNDLQGKDEGVSLEFLADQLTRGTRFHPAKKSRTKSEKLFYLLNAWANELDAEHGIMGIYRKIAAARVEYCRLNLKGMDEINDWTVEKPECLHDTVANDIDPTIHQHAPAFYKQLGDLNAKDWDFLAAELPNDYWEPVYRWKKQEIDDWKRHFGEATTLVDGSEQAVLGDSLPFLPRWFIGFESESLAESTEKESWTAERVSNHGTSDPLQYSEKVDWAWCCEYLVLYPNQAMSRLIPYLFAFSEEGTRFFPLSELELDDEAEGVYAISYFKPEPKGVHSISRSLSDRIQESLEELPDSWESTAPQLNNHPYLMWKQEREASVDEHIQAMLERTGRGRKPRQKSSVNERPLSNPKSEN